MAFPEARLPTTPVAGFQQRVWEAALLECGLLFMLAFVLQGLALTLPAALDRPVSLLIALLPGILWLLNSWWRGAYRPILRKSATACVLVTGLLCNAICLPLIEQVYETERWLPLENAITRIIGYSLTVGLTQALAVWLVVRYAVPRQDLAERLDLLVCCRAAALGDIVISSIDHAMTAAPTTGSQSVYVFNTAAALNCVAIIVSYAVAELYFRRAVFLLLPMIVTAFAAFVSGSSIPLVAGFSNAGLSSLQFVSDTSPLFGSFFSLGMLLTTWVVFRFLYATTGTGQHALVRSDGSP